MKKLLMLLILLLLVSCSNNNNNNNTANVEYTYDIKSSSVDMSGYSGVNSTNHNFKSITVSEFFNTVDNKSSGIFYLGRSNCGCCQITTKYVNDVAQELGVTVYYIDVYNEEEPLTDQATQDKLKEYMLDILNKDDTGEKQIYTPHLFTVINGKLDKNLVCYDNIDFSDSPSEKQEENLKKVYRDIMQPFAS